MRVMLGRVRLCRSNDMDCSGLHFIGFLVYIYLGMDVQNTGVFGWDNVLSLLWRQGLGWLSCYVHPRWKRSFGGFIRWHDCILHLPGVLAIDHGGWFC